MHSGHRTYQPGYNVTRFCATLITHIYGFRKILRTVIISRQTINRLVFLMATVIRIK
jgi:hypothetical protein